MRFNKKTDVFFIYNYFAGLLFLNKALLELLMAINCFKRWWNTAYDSFISFMDNAVINFKNDKPKCNGGAIMFIGTN